MPPQATPLPAGPSAAPLAVIDTQSVLDWQFFDNPACAGWLDTLQAGHWSWVATAAMRDELAHVLARGIAGRWRRPAEAVLDFFDQHARLCEVPVPPLQGWPRCSDPDDQKFVDLALAQRCRWLVSRDRAVLRLGRRCAPLTGLAIVPPDHWQSSGE